MNDQKEPEELGNIPQATNQTVDREVKKDGASRARVIDVGPAEGAGAVAIETQSQEGGGSASHRVLVAFSKSGKLADQVVAKIEEAFNATRCQFNKTTQAWDEIPDYKTRLAACELYLAHTVGLPIQRTENLNLTGKLPGQGEKRKPATPAMIAYLERELARAKRQAPAKSEQVT